jgi:hypothetical protein
MERPTAGTDERSAIPPIFFRRPRLLNAAVHHEYPLQPVPDPGFARTTNSVCLGMTEFVANRSPWSPSSVTKTTTISWSERTASGEQAAYVRTYPFIRRTGKERTKPLQRHEGDINIKILWVGGAWPQSIG